MDPSTAYNSRYLQYDLLVLEKMDSGYELVAQLATSENDTYELMKYLIY